MHTSTTRKKKRLQVQQTEFKCLIFYRIGGRLRAPSRTYANTSSPHTHIQHSTSQRSPTQANRRSTHIVSAVSVLSLIGREAHKACSLFHPHSVSSLFAPRSDTAFFKPTSTDAEIVSRTHQKLQERLTQIKRRTGLSEEPHSEVQ